MTEKKCKDKRGKKRGRSTGRKRARLCGVKREKWKTGENGGKQRGRGKKGKEIFVEGFEDYER